MSPSATQPAEDTKDILEACEAIDKPTFEQILEMDDDEDKEFSQSIVDGFFEQAETTFKKMEKAIVAQDLAELSRLGHFLKGSSATLGLTKVKDSCERIQNFGAQKDESGTVDEPDKSASLANIQKTLTEVKDAYDEISVVLKRFYGEEVEPKASG